MRIKSKAIKNFDSYEIIIEQDALSKTGLLIKEKIPPSRVFVLTNPKVYKLYYEKLKNAISKQGLRVIPIRIPDGERYKTLSSLKRAFDQLIKQKADRESLLIGLGGGVIGDLAGTAAATYMRGIPLVHIPTTLLAQSDAAIGGKTAVDLPQAKNLMGCFYPAKLVIIDPLVLNTLPEKEFMNGLVEIIKIGLVANSKIWNFVQKHYQEILEKNIYRLRQLISMAVAEKVRITNLDPYDRGVRKILNFGHTFGHALETYKNYQKISHGEAIVLGIQVALQLSADLKLASNGLGLEVKGFFSTMGLPTQIQNINLRKIWEIMNLDKKVKDGNVNFVLLQDIGKPILKSVNEKMFYKAVEKIP